MRHESLLTIPWLTHLASPPYRPVIRYVRMRQESLTEGATFGFTSARTLLAILRLSQVRFIAPRISPHISSYLPISPRVSPHQVLLHAFLASFFRSAKALILLASAAKAVRVRRRPRRERATRTLNDAYAWRHHAHRRSARRQLAWLRWQHQQATTSLTLVHLVRRASGARGDDPLFKNVLHSSRDKDTCTCSNLRGHDPPRGGPTQRSRGARNARTNLSL